MDDFYAARTANMAALPWSNFAPPFSDMEEINDFDLTRWYARYGFERVDNDTSAPCMMIAGPEILTEVRRINGYGLCDSIEHCSI